MGEQFNAAEWMAAWVKYHEYYILIPRVGVRIKPYQMWSPHNLLLFKTSYFLSALGWSMLIAVHLEEFLFWTWLLQVIHAQHSKTWFRSVWFKLWVLGVVLGTGVLFGAACIEMESLTRMEANIYFAGSIASFGMTCGSIWVVAKFPGFIRESRRQGASSEVLGKLNHFRQMNNARTSFRAVYSIPLLILSADGLTKAAVINHHIFWVDAFSAGAIFCVFGSMLLSLFVLLPRNISEESGLMARNNVFVRGTNHHSWGAGIPPDQLRSQISPGSASATTLPSYRPPMFSQNPWEVIGDRLNLEKQDVQDLAAMQNDSEFELPFTHPRARDDASFAPDYVEGPVPTLPKGQRTVKDFRSPLDIHQMDQPADLQIMMKTELSAKKD